MKHVYAPCIGGLPGVVLDGGMRELSGRMKEVFPGIETEVLPWFAWKKARNKAIVKWKAGELDFFAICGHSYGCMEAAKIASDVAKHGIRVRYIGAIDPTATPPGYGAMEIHSNVEQVDEFWAGFGWPAMARLRRWDGEAGGRYVYPHPTAHDVHKYPTKGHIALGSHDPVHETILKAMGAFAS